MPIIGSLGSGSAGGFGQRAAGGVPDVTPGNQSFTSSGTFTLQSGVYYNNLIFRVYGAGGGGSERRSADLKYNNPGPAGSAGTASSVAKSGITTIQGNGGGGAPENTANPSVGGSGGTASGGDTNTTGSSGSSGGN